MKEHAALESKGFILGLKLFLNQNLLKRNWVSKHLHSVVECNFHQAFPLETVISSALYQA